MNGVPAFTTDSIHTDKAIELDHSQTCDNKKTIPICKTYSTVLVD